VQAHIFRPSLVPLFDSLVVLFLFFEGYLQQHATLLTVDIITLERGNELFRCGHLGLVQLYLLFFLFLRTKQFVNLLML
jgi:hypothetical protein